MRCCGRSSIGTREPRSPVHRFSTMLRTLSIRDFVIVDRLDLEFSSGFTVLTGETGAGKSILVDALGLVLGDRADTEVIRHGAERAEISVEFDLKDAKDASAWRSEERRVGKECRCRWSRYH